MRTKRVHKSNVIGGGCVSLKVNITVLSEEGWELRSKSPSFILIMTEFRLREIILVLKFFCFEKYSNVSVTVFNLEIFIWLSFMCARSVMSDSLQPYGLSSARLFCPWDFSGRNTGFLFPLRGSSQSRDQNGISCIGRQILYHWAAWEAPKTH